MPNLIVKQVASELWPENLDSDGDIRSGDDEDDLEDQIAKELALMKHPRKERRFGECLCIQY